MRTYGYQRSKHDGEFELQGKYEEEWNGYILGLQHDGIRLTNKADEIVWSWNEKNGQVTTKLAYEDAMFSSIEDN